MHFLQDMPLQTKQPESWNYHRSFSYLQIQVEDDRLFLPLHRQKQNYSVGWTKELEKGSGISEETWKSKQVSQSSSNTSCSHPVVCTET